MTSYFFFIGHFSLKSFSPLVLVHMYVFQKKGYFIQNLCV